MCSKPTIKQVHTSPALISLLRGPWVKGAVDIVGPVNRKFLLTYIDYYSSNPKAHILRQITSHEVIRVLTDIFARFGFPEELVSDNVNNL